MVVRSLFRASARYPAPLSDDRTDCAVVAVVWQAEIGRAAAKVQRHVTARSHPRDIGGVACDVPALRQGGNSMTATSTTDTLTIRSTPENVVRGHLTVSKSPIARVQPGQTVTIETVSGAGLRLDGPDPVAFFGAHGIA